MNEIVKAYTVVDGLVVGFRSTDSPQVGELVLPDDDALVLAYFAPITPETAETTEAVKS